MKLLFELSHPGKGAQLIPATTLTIPELPDTVVRRSDLPLPELSEVEVDRHYHELSHQVYGVCDGFYPLGSCTMKYNPRINERLADLSGFTSVHPLAPEYALQGTLEALTELEDALAEITGMHAVTIQPAAGAHGELCGMLMIRAYHLSRGDTERTKVIIPDSAHGTNPATATMAGFTCINIPSNKEGGVDLDALQKALGPDVAGLMLTNPNTLGLFDPNITKICEMMHSCGALCYYDGANLNPIMGVVRPGDMGFDVVHLNLHKTFATPHGGGGPGCGAVGCKALLADFLPRDLPRKKEDGEGFELAQPKQSIGRMRSFLGNVGVALRALSYILSLGREGIAEAAQMAALNANYLKHRLAEHYPIAFEGTCMHEFVMDLTDYKEKYGVSALDLAKRLLDYGVHPPTMYFPLIVHEALMLEPTETETLETLDEAAEIFAKIAEEARTNPELLKGAPHTTPIGRPDETTAARSPVVTWKPTAAQ